ncbi:MAG: chromosome segregation protein SMC [Myxococcales bacterium]
MRIKRLDICGFKSFMDKMTFQFDDHVTGVVGPNGCGKSNVVDAIRWVMGEQSAKNLRGRGMEDVIFNGSENKPPLSMAEVTITFYNDNPALLPAQYQGFPEISVTRRLFRNGESEYLINRTPCRLLDVTELFLGTGVGTRAYSIIEQGRIGLIVSAKPEDRRSLIEEAAGITRYKARRKAAERKMEHTEQNLLRVTDIVNELGKRLDSLNRQAKKAEKYRKLKAEMREIELHTASHKFLELNALMTQARAAMEGLGGEERELADKVLNAEAEIESLKARLIDEEKALSALNEQVHQLDNELKVGAANLEAWGREAEEQGRRAGEANRELGDIAVATSSLQTEKEVLEGERAALLGGGGELDRLTKAQKEYEALRLEEELTAHRLDEERSALVTALSRMAASKSQLENLVRQKADLELRIKRVEGERDELQARVLDLEKMRSENLQKLGTSRQMKLDLEARRAGEEEALERSRREFMEQEAKLIAAREELVDRRSRLNSLKEIEKNYEGYGRGVRAVMLKAGNRAKDLGILGLVSDLVRAPAEVEQAIEAVLGDRLQSIVVSDGARALDSISFLKSAREGRGAFLPLTMHPAAQEPVDTSVPGVVGLASELVQHDEPYAPVVKHLLGNVVVVRDLEAAVAYSKSGRPHTVVTLDGEVIEPSGAVSGGALEGPGVGALQKKREIGELEGQVAAVERELQVEQERHRRLAERIASIEGALKGLAKDSHSEDLAVVEQEKDLHKVSEDIAHIRERLEKLQVEEEGLKRAHAAILAEESSSQGESLHAGGDRESREARVKELAETLTALRAKMSELGAEQTTLKVKVASENERREGIDRNLARIESTLFELSERRVRLENTLAEATAREAELKGKQEGARSEHERLAKKLGRLAQEQQAAREAYEATGNRVREADDEIRTSRKKLDELQGGLSSQAFKEKEYALELQHLIDAIRDRHAVELQAEVSRFHQLPPPTPETEEKLYELREQVERMGEINLTAIEEFQEISQRHEFLAKQKKDLEESLVQLRKAISRINKTSQERFKETFEIVNEKFQQIFPRLFNGGRAGLVMVEGDEKTEAGIEIMAQPPGKKLQSVNLLSGGEKALTAVSLIFAIFLIKPTPFCLLDEVDAPLDDANVDRYNDMVKEMSEQSQFILITHNKKTMFIADTLYGVTMEEPGISKLVSVKLSERAGQVAPPPEPAAAG